MTQWSRKLLGARMLAAILVAAGTSSALLACASDSSASSPNPYASLIAFDTAHVRMVSNRDTTVVTVELAESTDQQTMGLMERRALSPDAGMLFMYSSVQPESSAFWMFRTRIPLDIAFIDSVGVIRSLRTMAPCQSVLAEGCPSYAADARYIAALEVNAGYFARKRMHVGDRVLLQDTVSRRRAAQPPRS